MKQYIIPWQLAREKFIILAERDKKPLHNWKEETNHYSAAKAQKWVDAGFNYGVLYTSNLCVIDADRADLMPDVISELSESYIVRSGRASGTGRHIYLRISGEVPIEFAGKKSILIDKKTGEDVGDVRYPHSPFYNVAPYSTHPDGGQYLPIDPDADILTIKFDELDDILKSVDVKKPKDRTTHASINEYRNKQQSNTDGATSRGRYAGYGFTCFDFLTPLNPRVRGGEVEGVHPIHGSTTGSNLSISNDGSVWYCRRCGSGGGWLQALAVSYGIIGCSDAGRPFTKDELRQIDYVLRKLKPRVFAENFRAYRTQRVEQRKKIMMEIRKNDR